jgi:hypothetical protein
MLDSACLFCYTSQVFILFPQTAGGHLAIKGIFPPAEESSNMHEKAIAFLQALSALRKEPFVYFNTRR